MAEKTNQSHLLLVILKPEEHPVSKGLTFLAHSLLKWQRFASQSGPEVFTKEPDGWEESSVHWNPALSALDKEFTVLWFGFLICENGILRPALQAIVAWKCI